MATEPDKNADSPVLPKQPLHVVFDMNQRGDKPRNHDIIVKVYKEPGREPDTMSYGLWREKPTPMPWEHAIKFLCDPAFKVIAPSGNRVMPIEKIDLSKPITKLEITQVVARYTDLSREYLFKLVKMAPGSEDVPKNATVEELAAFMVKWRESLSGMTEGERHVAELMAAGGLDGMDDGMLNTMFPDRARKAA